MAPRYSFIGVAPLAPDGAIRSGWPPRHGTTTTCGSSATCSTSSTRHVRGPGRVYSTGMSNGAQMSSLLACRIPNRITAVRAVAESSSRTRAGEAGARHRVPRHS
jgi:hypothetical protein